MQKIGVKIRKMHSDVKIPVYKTEGAACFDFHSIQESVILPGETKKISTGIKMEIPPGYYLRIEDRSGVAVKGVHKVAGIIDSDYRGEILIVLHNTTNEEYKIDKFDRVAQGIVKPVLQADFEEVEELSESIRGEGGFNSTGK